MLHEENCTSTYSDAKPLNRTEIDSLLSQISPEWKLKEDEKELRLQKEFRFKDFQGSLYFTNLIGRIAEDQNHHPAILTEWGKVTISWWTHIVHGLHRNDFIMAARTDEVYKSAGE
jgi:4a-hydroxytetrahydrobiopterin dehydratase